MNGITSAFIEVNGKILVGGESTFGPFLCATTNSGTSWVTSFNGIGAPVLSIAASGNRLLASSATTMYASTDTGRTWTNSSSGLASFTGAYAIVSFGNTVFAGTTAGTYMSTNNGQQWTQRDASTWYWTLGIFGSTLFGATGNFGKMFSSTDDGMTWNSVSIGVTDYNVSQIIVAGGNIYCATSWAGIRMSSDGGTNWSKITPDSLNNIYTVRVNGSDILAGSDNGRVWVSNNSGQSWTNISADIPSGNVIKGFVYSGNYALVAVRQNRVWRRPLSEITSVSEIKSSLPTKFSLEQNFPNPFNPTTNIGFQISEYGFVSLKVFDVLGKEVSTLVNENLSAGKFSVDWNTENIPSGMYFYKLTTNNFSLTKKMLLAK
ncbi:MAG: T9SS type A sorting domain-containing protein [Ignavibacteriales bacterium]|nr:T9SS type A sorting domain-containing protein [Ignavibacteriales bacterium]